MEHKKNKSEQELINDIFIQISNELSEIIITSESDPEVLRKRLVYDETVEGCYLQELIRRSKSESGHPAVVVYAIKQKNSHYIPRHGDLLIGFAALDKEHGIDAFDLDIGGNLVEKHAPLNPGEIRLAIHSNQQSIPLISLAFQLVSCKRTNSSSATNMPWLLYACLDTLERRILATYQFTTCKSEMIAYGSGVLQNASSLKNDKLTLMLPHIVLPNF